MLLIKHVVSELYNFFIIVRPSPLNPYGFCLSLSGQLTKKIINLNKLYRQLNETVLYLSKNLELINLFLKIGRKIQKSLTEAKYDHRINITIAITQNRRSLSVSKVTQHHTTQSSVHQSKTQKFTVKESKGLNLDLKLNTVIFGVNDVFFAFGNT